MEEDKEQGYQDTDESRENQNKADAVETEGLIPIKQLMGMLKPDGPMLSDEDVEEIKYQYLMEKYGYGLEIAPPPEKEESTNSQNDQ